MMTKLWNPKEDIFRLRLKEARRLRDVTQAELSRASGVPLGAIGHFETGTRLPSFRSFRKLAEALDVSADYLAGSSPEISKSKDRDFDSFKRLSVDDRAIVRGLLKILLKRRGRNADDG